MGVKDGVDEGEGVGVKDGVDVGEGVGVRVICEVCVGVGVSDASADALERSVMRNVPVRKTNPASNSLRAGS